MNKMELVELGMLLGDPMIDKDRKVEAIKSARESGLLTADEALDVALDVFK